MRSFKAFILLAACTAFLSACGETREFMGLNAAAPDEFMVVDQPPLSMPPDYALRPPRPGQPNFRDVAPSKQAAQALYGTDKMELVQQQGVSSLPNQNLSSSEQALISSSGSASADPTIRSRLDREASQQVVTSRRLMDQILFWREPKKVSTLVDAPEERKRIEAAQKNNQPINSGSTPITGDKNVTAVP